MDKLTNVDWIWEQRFPVEKLTEEELKELNRIAEELCRVKLLNIEEIGDISMSDERPTWVVYVENFNQKRIEEYNIFDHDLFWDGCQIAWVTAEDNATTVEEQMEDFNERIMIEIRYYFWGKSQWEIELTTPISRDDFKNNKIDVSDQIKLNEKQFLTYLWNWFTERKLENNG